VKQEAGRRKREVSFVSTMIAYHAGYDWQTRFISYFLLTTSYLLLSLPLPESASALRTIPEVIAT